MLFQAIDDGTTYTLDQRAGETDQLIVAVGGGRGCVLRSEVPVAGIWIPLRARVQLSTGGSEAELLDEGAAIGMVPKCTPVEFIG